MVCLCRRFGWICGGEKSGWEWEWEDGSEVYRSWTGFLVAEVEVVVGKGGDNRVERKGEARVVSIQWEESESVVRGQRERDAKETVREVCRWVLGVDLGTDE